MEGNTKRSRLNISDEHKCFLWTPAKTGSQHATIVLSHFSFSLVDCSYDRKEIFDFSEFPTHNHRLDLFEGHENYKLICTARNPIHRIFSSFIYSHKFKQNLTKNDFVFFFNDIISKNDFLWLGTMKKHMREPDYFIRLEHMYEDYLKIPFVSESIFAKSGALKEICNRKQNSTPKQGLNIRDVYTSDMIDYLYYEFKEYFDKLGYKPEI